MKGHEGDTARLPRPQQTQRCSQTTHVRGRRKPICKDDQERERISGKHRTTRDDFPLRGNNRKAAPERQVRYQTSSTSINI